MLSSGEDEEATRHSQAGLGGMLSPRGLFEDSQVMVWRYALWARMVSKVQFFKENRQQWLDEVKRRVTWIERLHT